MTSTPDIVPDDRDWTWVLQRPCQECGFEASEFDPTAVAEAIRDNAVDWVEVLGGNVGELRRRRRPDRWSDLEYAAHVCDVFVLYRERLEMMLDELDPLYPNWDQDATAVAQAYNEQDPADVSMRLVDAATTLADAFAELGDDRRAPQWRRTGRRSDGASFTVDSFARYLIHDPIHHLWDVRGGSGPLGVRP